MKNIDSMQEPRPTTTCAHCNRDFLDRDMLPLDAGGELCHNCMDTLRDAAPDLLSALIMLKQRLHENIKLDVRNHFSLLLADASAGNAIAKATKKETQT